MKILLLGGQGQVGWELQRVLLPLGHIICPQREQLDLADLDKVQRFLSDLDVDVIVNAAAYTAVDQAEQETQLADRLNHQLPGLLAEKAKTLDALLIHYSTDYVFDGNKNRPYRESDAANPLGVYGQSKWEGEQAIQQTGGNYLIFRTSWVYATRGRNFLLSIRRLAAERSELRIVDDQIGAPTWARLIAQTSAYCLRQALLEKRQVNFVSGLYHLSAAGHTSWYGFAKAIVELLAERGENLKLQCLQPIPTSAYLAAAVRPANSRLDVSALEKQFELVMPKWDKTLRLCMEELDT